MAEKEGHSRQKNAHTPRTRPGQSRIYHHLGVSDLRELLNRKRREGGYVNEAGIPPPDPSYNYLKDPLRENAEDNSPRHNSMRKYYNKNNLNSNLKRERDQHSGNASNYSKNKDIENPLNIKIEFSPSTGEHVYKLDESTVLPTIKHVPDQIPPQNRSFRGRGRGRGRGQQRSYYTRTIRSNNSSRKPASEQTLADQHSHVEVATNIQYNLEENWDDDLNENKEIHDEEISHEEVEKEYDEHLNELPEQNSQGNEDIQEDLEKRIENLKLKEADTVSENAEKSELGKKNSV